MLTFNQSQMLEQAKFAYSLLRKAIKKQTKKIGDHGGKTSPFFKSFKTC